MICPEQFHSALFEYGVGLITGVPDSLLAGFCRVADEPRNDGSKHVIAANEGNAMAIASGYFLATGKPAAVYMQNSGLGNAVNPLVSLLDPAVYGIPVLMIVGWRGRPGVVDEPQHVKQGSITTGQLDLMGIPFWTIDAESSWRDLLKTAIAQVTLRGGPGALLVAEKTFPEAAGRNGADLSPLARETAIGIILSEVREDDLLVSTTGKISRELLATRLTRNELPRDFLCVGAMGHALSISLGVALGNPRKRVICIDGDGSVLMHLGALPVTGGVGPPNLVHILLNNGAHESVGGQPTVAGSVDFGAIAKAVNFRNYFLATCDEELRRCLVQALALAGPTLLEVKVAMGSRPNLGRPSGTPKENMQAFVQAARS